MQEGESHEELLQRQHEKEDLSIFGILVLFSLVVILFCIDQHVLVVLGRESTLGGVLFQLLVHNPVKVTEYTGSTMVLLRCVVDGPKERIPTVDEVCAKWGVRVDIADCVPEANGKDARETGIILRWIINNYDLMKSGFINRVVFHHHHETSHHQRGQTLSSALNRLFEARQYYFGYDFGDIFPFYLEKAINYENGVPHFRVKGIEIFNMMERITEGTSFRYFNRTNSNGRWRNGQATGFFISAAKITSVPKSDYETLLKNVHRAVYEYSILGVTKDANYLVGEVMERMWQVIFSNCTWPCYNIPGNFGWWKVIHQDNI